MAQSHRTILGLDRYPMKYRRRHEATFPLPPRLRRAPASVSFEVLNRPLVLFCG
jgi:hypothetical protein